MNLHTVIKKLGEENKEIKLLNNDELTILHKVLLDMIKDFSDICNEYNIKWSLTAGNMLGAVRHKGFIPWDDDIDVIMTRFEFDKLKSKFQDNDKYYLASPGDDGYILHYPRIFKKNTKFRSLLSVDDGHNGLYIDIFLLENVPNNVILKYLHGTLCTILLGVISSVRVNYCKKTLMKYSDNNKVLRNEINKRLYIGRIFSIIPIEKWMACANKCFSMCKNETSQNVVIPSGAKHYFGEIFNREKLCTYTKVKFENLLLPIPLNYEHYLKLRYGDSYMIPPKETVKEKRALIEYQL